MKKPVNPENSSANWLVGGGEMGQLIRAMDWSQTPLGPLGTWPQSLRTTVSLCLASNFPISLAWGREHTQIYNDGYWPICGGKHPQSMGQDFSQCWASAWPAIGAAFESALAGKTSFLEDQRMFLDRNGYLEETFFTFSFSPIHDESGGVGGLFHPVTETTGKMVGERRTRQIRDLAARTGKAQASDDVYALAAHTLKDFSFDLPFILFYLIEEKENGARLVAHAGIALETPISPRLQEIRFTSSDPWSFTSVIKSNQLCQVDGLDPDFQIFLKGPYPEPPKTAMVMPITPAGRERPVAVMVAGVSSRLPLNENYRAFYDLLAGTITASVANAQAYEEERRRAEALAQIDRAKTAFFSNVSHEFRTPLTLMLGPLEEELAEKNQPLPPARRERLESAHRNSLRLLKLVNTLLDFSRIESGRIEATYVPIDLSTYTQELAGVFRSAIEKANLTLTVDCPPLPEPIHVDKEMWEKIVLNLLSNAFKHTFKGGITLALRWKKEVVELSVTDSGVGIAKAELPRLFERFYRVKGAKSRTYEGTGIGLALVQELAALHGGAVAVESEEGQGTTFKVTIKTGHAHLSANSAIKNGQSILNSKATRASAYVEEALRWLPDEVKTPPVKSRASVLRPHVLLADDNADLRAYVAGLLEPHYEVQAVSDGLLAFSAALEKKPDLILSDVMMPNLDGLGLLRKLRETPQTRTLPVILLSARTGEESSVEGLESGADDYLSKPFSARELLARVKTHLELGRLRRKWAEELEEANKELEAFSYSVSHDLRAPLRAIDGFSNILLEDYVSQLDATAQKHLRRIREAAQRMGQLIDGLLKLAHLNRDHVRMESVNLSALSQELIKELQDSQPERVVTFKIEPAVQVRGDPDYLRIALGNLLANAWKFSEKTNAPVIEFGIHLPAGSESIYFVRDNGAGFDMAYRDKLFGAFQRLHSVNDFPGTGIGLATVERIIRRHGGKIWAEAQVGLGATFYFKLGTPTSY